MQPLRPVDVPGLIDWPGTNTTVIADSASMDFPLTPAAQQLSRGLYCVSVCCYCWGWG